MHSYYKCKRATLLHVNFFRIKVVPKHQIKLIISEKSFFVMSSLYHSIFNLFSSTASVLNTCKWVYCGTVWTSDFSIFTFNSANDLSFMQIVTTTTVSASWWFLIQTLNFFKLSCHRWVLYDKVYDFFSPSQPNYMYCTCLFNSKT